MSRPLKPWERAGGGAQSSGLPFAPSSLSGSTADVVAAAGTEGDDPTAAEAALNGVGRSMPSRPWERGGPTSGSYNSVSPYNRTGMGLGMGGGTSGMSGGYSGYGSSYGSSYGSPYSRMGGYGSSMGGSSMGGSSYGMGSSMYNRGYGGYGGGYGAAGGMGSYGGMGSSSYGGMGGYGMGGTMGGGMGGPYGHQGMMGDPNDPNGGMPPQPPSWWQKMVQVLHGMMNFFGRLAVLVNENTAAFHFFITALLELFDRSGSLYAELLRFVLRLFGIKPRPPKAAHPMEGQQGGKGARIALPNSVEEGKGRMGLPPSKGSMIPRSTGGEPPAAGWDSLWGPS